MLSCNSATSENPISKNETIIEQEEVKEFCFETLNYYLFTGRKDKNEVAFVYGVSFKLLNAHELEYRLEFLENWKSTKNERDTINYLNCIANPEPFYFRDDTLDAYVFYNNTQDLKFYIINNPLYPQHNNALVKFKSDTSWLELTPILHRK